MVAKSTRIKNSSKRTEEEANKNAVSQEQATDGNTQKAPEQLVAGTSIGTYAEPPTNEPTSLPAKSEEGGGAAGNLQENKSSIQNEGGQMI